MLIYTENDCQSDKRIKHKNLLYKTQQKYKNTFQEFEQSKK